MPIEPPAPGWPKALAFGEIGMKSWRSMKPRPKRIGRPPSTASGPKACSVARALDRLGREQPHAVERAAARERAVDARERARGAVAVRRRDLGAAPRARVDALGCRPGGLLKAAPAIVRRVASCRAGTGRGARGSRARRPRAPAARGSRRARRRARPPSPGSPMWKSAPSGPATLVAEERADAPSRRRGGPPRRRGSRR